MNKKGILFAIVTLIIVLPLFLLSLSFIDNNFSYDNIFLGHIEAEKLSFIESDVVKNIYSDLLSINLDSITRDSSIIIKFNQALLMPNMNYFSITSNYKNFVQTTYAKLNNINIALNGFNNTFKILPYNTTFSINGTALHLFTMPLETNYVKSITLTVIVNSSSDGDCQGVRNDKGSFPAVTTITVTYINRTGGACIQTKNLNPTENNDKGNNKQFYQALLQPTGSIETKFGKVNGIDGVLAILTSNATANITQLDVEYSLINEKIILLGGNISIASSTISKNTEMILAEE